jgi:hypothetical protein
MIRMLQLRNKGKISDTERAELKSLMTGREFRVAKPGLLGWSETVTDMVMIPLLAPKQDREEIVSLMYAVSLEIESHLR